MNREIKFRAWDGKTIRYPSNDGLYVYLDGRYGVHKDNGGDKLECELMQYTGLKDKNGKEIYEGDIVKIKGHGVCEVIFSSGCFIIKGELGYQNPITNQYSGKRCEVIGNIYENHELLK